MHSAYLNGAKFSDAPDAAKDVRDRVSMATDREKRGHRSKERRPRSMLVFGQCTFCSAGIAQFMVKVPSSACGKVFHTLGILLVSKTHLFE